MSEIGPDPPPIPGVQNSNAGNYRQDRSDHRRITRARLRADLGAPAAPLTIGQSIPGVVDTIEAQAGKGGLQYLDYQGRTVRW
jgi:hypothetical protein